MRSSALIAAAAALVACATQQTDTRLLGAWQSNAELTLREFEALPEITPEQLVLLSDPTLFGHMVQVYGSRQAIVVFDGECTATPYEVVARSENSVDIRYYDSFYEERVTKRILFGDASFSIPAGRAREIFSQVELERITNEHPCIRDHLESAGVASAG